MVGSVELLILLCCLRSGSMEWFPMVALCVLFGSSLLMLPVFLLAVSSSCSVTSSVAQMSNNSVMSG